MTDKDIQELWKLCGFEYSHSARTKNFSTGALGKMVKFYVYPSGEVGDLPEPTLDSLFKYAVPAVVEQVGDKATFILLVQWIWGLDLTLDKETAIDALAKACLGVLRK